MHQQKKGALKFILIPVVLVLAVCIAVAVFSVQPGNFSRQDVMDLAVAHVGGGNANWPEMDFQDLQRVWSVEVFQDGLVHEVFINRFSGEIVRVEIDGWD